MRLITVGTLAMAIDTAMCYLNTSPFFMFSTSSECQLSSSTDVGHAAALSKDVYKVLAQCPSEYYIVVQQPGVSSSDYTSSKAAPNLARNLSPAARKSGGIRSQSIFAELIDQPKTSSWERVLSENCHAETLQLNASTGSIPTLGSHKLLRVSLPAPSESSRTADLSSNDAYLASVIDLLPTNDFTVLYVTSPSPHAQKVSSTGGSKEENKQYEMESPLIDVMHQELKRDLGAHAAKIVGNQTIVDGPLFEKYQFLSPGIFMGFSVGLILLLILYVGISAISGLQVTYAAFDKESGPLAGKKSQ